MLLLSLSFEDQAFVSRFHFHIVSVNPGKSA